MRAPLRFVYGNLCLGGSERDAWALFVARPHPFDGLTAADKRERFSRLVSALEAIEADLQILRVSRPFDVAQYTRDLLAERAAHSEPLEALACRASPAPRGPRRPRALDRDRRPARSPPRVTPPLSRATRGRDGAGGRTRCAPRSAWEEPRVLSLARLEALRVRADEAHARLAAYLDVRPARTVEVQWLVRRAFCRGLGEPEVDGLHEPQALVFERNGQAMLAPLEADVLRWSDGYIDHRGRRLRVESELGVSWQAQLVVGALPERGVFPSARPRCCPRSPTACPSRSTSPSTRASCPTGRPCGSCGGASRTPTRSCAPRTTATRGSATRATSARRPRATCSGYLQSASHPPLLRASLAVAVAAADPEELERRVAACRRAFGEIALHRPLGEQLELFCQHLPGQPSRARGYEDTLTVEQVAAMMPTAGHPIGSRQRPVSRPHAERRALPGALRPARGLAQRPPDDGAGRRLAGLGQDDPHPGAALPRLPGRRADRRHRPQGRSPLPPPRRGRTARARRSPCAPSRACAACSTRCASRPSTCATTPPSRSSATCCPRAPTPAG